MNKEQKLYDYLEKHHIGRDKAVHSKKLEKKFDICPRTVRTYINNLRKSGYPVCSDDKGYWIATPGICKQELIRRCPNGATRQAEGLSPT